MSENGRRRAQRSWCLYDWANSTFATSVVAAILPVYFAHMAGRTMAAHDATAVWGYASAAALAVTAVLSPIVGALADQSRRRKPVLLVCVLMGCAGTLGLSLASGESWNGLLVAFSVAFVAFATGNVLYDSLLPAVASPGEMHQVSARGFAWGYLGGGLLELLHVRAGFRPPAVIGVTGRTADLDVVLLLRRGRRRRGGGGGPRGCPSGNCPRRSSGSSGARSRGSGSDPICCVSWWRSGSTRTASGRSSRWPRSTASRSAWAIAT